MPSEEVPGAPAVITDRARAPAAAAVPRAWDLEEAVAAVVAAGGVDKWPRSRQGSQEYGYKLNMAKASLSGLFWIAGSLAFWRRPVT
jgi:hypothetical protein